MDKQQDELMGRENHYGKICRLRLGEKGLNDQ